MSLPALPIDPDQPDINLIVDLPPSANRIWRVSRNRVHRSAEYEAWLTTTIASIAEQRTVDAIPGHYAAVYVLPVTRRDADNACKTLGDVLQKAAVVANDRLAERITIAVDRSRNAPTVRIELWALPDPVKPKRPSGARAAT